jgi:hypothetical protein
VESTRTENKLDSLEAAKCAKTKTSPSSMNHLVKKYLIGYANNTNSVVLKEIASIDVLRFDVQLATNAKEGNVLKHVINKLIKY